MNHNSTNGNELELNEREASAARKAGAVVSHDDPVSTPSGIRETSSGLSETSPALGDDPPKLRITKDPTPDPSPREYVPPVSNLPERVSQAQTLADSRKYTNITGWPDDALVTEE